MSGKGDVTGSSTKFRLVRGNLTELTSTEVTETTETTKERLLRNLYEVDEDGGGDDGDGDDD